MNMIFGEILSQVDSRLVYVLGGLLIASVVIAIIKKAIKLAIIVGLIAFCVTSVGPVASRFQDKYKFEVDRDTAIITIDNKNTAISKVDTKSIQLVNHGISGYTLNIAYNDGMGSITIPSFMVNKVKSFADKIGVPVDVRD